MGSVLSGFVDHLCFLLPRWDLGLEASYEFADDCLLISRVLAEDYLNKSSKSEACSSGAPPCRARLGRVRVNGHG